MHRSDDRVAPDDYVRWMKLLAWTTRRTLDHDEGTDDTSAPTTASGATELSRSILGGRVALGEQADSLGEGCVGIAATQQRARGLWTEMARERFADDDRGGADGGELREVLRIGDKCEIARARTLDGHQS